MRDTETQAFKREGFMEMTALIEERLKGYIGFEKADDSKLKECHVLKHRCIK